MANFYPLNTPFINYYFYKASFVNNAYSLTGVAVDNGGTGYAVNDIIVCGGGTYTSPVVLQVTGVSSGAVTSVQINYNGKYTVTPTSFTQLSTNGSGTGATFNTLVFDPNIYQPGPNYPLSGGFIYFYEDENRTVKANTYSDVSNPSSPVVNPNPIQLGASGDFPPIYMEDRLYYIVITDNTGDEANPVEVLEHYNPEQSAAQVSAFNDNFIVNPQFNYPIVFYKTTDEEGEITQPNTVVAWGWQFLEDADTDSENYITFGSVSGLGIEGSPLNEIILTTGAVDANETTKDFRSFLGAVDFYSESDLTFSAQMVSKNGSSISVKLFLELNYGNAGSEAEIIELTTFTVTPVRSKFKYSFTMPSLAGKTIGPANFSAIHIQPALKAVCIFGMTNAMTLPGIVSNPIFSDEPVGFSKAQILGESTLIEDAGLTENYSQYMYTDGKIFPYADTATIVLAPTNVPQAFRHICDGSTLDVNGYSPENIPYRRLFDSIGTEFGGAGDLVVTSNQNVVTFESPVGARQKSDYTAGTTSFTVSNTIVGLFQGIDLVNNNDMTLTATFIDDFAPLQTPPAFGPNIVPGLSNNGNGLMTYWGINVSVINPANFLFTTIDPGSVSTQASLTIEFQSDNPADYKTRQGTPTGTSFTQCSSFIEFAAFDNNVRQIDPYRCNELIMFSLDGHYDSPIGQITPGVQAISSAIEGKVVPFVSTLSMLKNIQIFVKTIANPFQWTVTVTAAPTAGQYFLYSSKTVDYYAWFTVNGAGVDPAVASRTGVEIPIFSGQSEEQIATIIAQTINNATFSVPSTSDLPALVSSSKVSWFINL